MNQKPNLHQSSTSQADKIMELFKSIQKSFRDKLFEKSKQYGFTAPQLGLIFVLYKNPFITLNELSELMGLSKSTVSGIVDRLVGHKIVTREIPENNRRTVSLSLSKEFLENNDLIDLKNKYIADIIKGASTKQIEDIIIGLETLENLITQNK